MNRSHNNTVISYLRRFPRSLYESIELRILSSYWSLPHCLHCLQCLQLYTERIRNIACAAPHANRKLFLVHYRNLRNSEIWHDSTFEVTVNHQAILIWPDAFTQQQDTLLMYILLVNPGHLLATVWPPSFLNPFPHSTPMFCSSVSNWLYWQGPSKLFLPLPSKTPRCLL